MTSKHYRFRCQTRRENPDRSQYCFQPIKFVNMLVHSHIIKHHIIQYLPYYRSSGCIGEVKNKGKFQTFSSKTGRSHLREVVTYKTSGCKDRDLIGKLLVFWKPG